MAEIDRINYRSRPHLAYQPQEDYLNSRSMVSFDDETRAIRAQTAALLRRIHAPIPRASRPLPVVMVRYEESPFPERITSDTYINRMLHPITNVQQDVMNMSHYNEPGGYTRHNIGKGHLACVSYAGGRAFSRRRNLFHDDDERVKNDIKYLSHYEKNREAAKHPHQHVTFAGIPRQL